MFLPLFVATRIHAAHLAWYRKQKNIIPRSTLPSDPAATAKGGDSVVAPVLKKVKREESGALKRRGPEKGGKHVFRK